jgi:hypothetical protein
VEFIDLPEEQVAALRKLTGANNRSIIGAAG